MTKIALTPKQKLLLKTLTESYFVVSIACRKANISRMTYYRWLKNSEFKEKLEEIDQDLLTAIEDRLKSAALENQPWAIRFFLGRRHPDYKAKYEVEERPKFIYEEGDFPELV